MVASYALQAVASALLLAVGGWLVLQGQLTIGQLVAAEIVVSSVLAGVAKLGKQLESYYDLATALEKLGTVTDLPPEAPVSVKEAVMPFNRFRTTDGVNVDTPLHREVTCGHDSCAQH